MADPRIRIIVEATAAAAKRELEKVKGTVKDVGKEAEKSGVSFDKALKMMAVAAGAVTTAIVAMKKAWDFAKEGAEIAQTQASFDGLVRSLGQGPEVMDALRAASRGTVDDMTIMKGTLALVAGASDELAARMIETSPQLMEIAKAANKLNPTLGTTAQMYESISIGIKRGQPLILDNLGLTIKVGEANEQFAAKLGKTVEALTAEEKQMALLEATLKAGDQMIQQVGGNVDAMGDNFARAEVQLKNATDELKTRTVPIMAELADNLADSLAILTDMPGVIGNMTKAAASGTDTHKEYVDSFIKLAEESGMFRGISEDMIQQLRNYALGVGEASEDTIYLADKIGLMSKAAYDSYEAFQKATGGMDNFVHAQDAWIERQQEEEEAARNVGKAYDDRRQSLINSYAANDTAAIKAGLLAEKEREAAAAAEAVARAADAAKAAQDRFNQSMDELHMAIQGEFGKSIEEYHGTVVDLTGQMEELLAKERELSGQPLVTNAQSDRLVDLRADIEETKGKLEEAKGAYAALLSEGADEEKLATAQGNIDKWQGKLDELNTKVGRTWRDISQNTSEELGKVREDIAGVSEALDEASAAFEENTKQMMFNIAEAQIMDALQKGLIEDVNASGTAYDEAQTMLWTLGETMGLVDQDTVNLMTATQKLTGELINQKTNARETGQNFNYLAGELTTAAEKGDDLKKSLYHIPEKRKSWIDHNFGEAASAAGGVGDAVRGIPSHKSVRIDVKTYYTSEGTPVDYKPKVGQEGRRQHGGPVRAGAGYLVGEAGPELFVPQTGGYVVPNNQISHNYNLAIHTSAPAESALSDFSVMRALAGV